MRKDTKKITIVIVSWFSYTLVECLIKNLVSKALFPNNIQFYIIDNSNGKDKQLQSLKGLHCDLAIDAIDNNGLKGSWAHAFGLNYATKRVETEYTLVVDPDIYVFKTNWDDYFTKELKSLKAFAVGAPYPYWKLGKYHDFPSPPFILYDTNSAKDIGLDWTPFALNPVRRAYNILARQIVRAGFMATRDRLNRRPPLRRALQQIEKILGVCGPDTGWLIAKKAKKEGYKSILFYEGNVDDPFIKTACSAPLNTLVTEFEVYHHKEELMITHKYSTNSYLWKTLAGNDTDLWHSLIEQIENKRLTKDRILKSGRY